MPYRESLIHRYSNINNLSDVIRFYREKFTDEQIRKEFMRYYGECELLEYYLKEGIYWGDITTLIFQLTGVVYVVDSGKLKRIS